MAPPRPAPTARPTALLVVLCAATFMSSLDVFIVNVGLRPIGRALGESSLADLSWILNAYAIVFAALLVPAGRLADRYGVKAAFLLGLGLFTLGSLGSALSGDLWLLVALRCVQALGAAALVPTSLGLLLTAMPPARVPASIRLWAISGSLGAVAGPALGGLLVELSWRWIFIVNVPVGLAALVAAAVLAPHSRHGDETRVPDLLGGALLAIGIGSLTLALVQGPGWGWVSARTLSALAVALVGVALVLLRSTRVAAPVIDLDLFADRSFGWASLANLVLGVSFAMQLLALVLWLQEGWGWSAVRTGLAIAPGPVMVSVAALGLRPRLARLSDGAVAVLGALLMGGGGVIIGVTLGPAPRYAAQVLPGWLVIGLGVGLALPTLVHAATAGLPPHRSATGSALVQMGRQVGSVVGVAVLVVVVGSAGSTREAVTRFADAWWWAGAFALLAALAAAPLAVRRPAGASAGAPVVAAEPPAWGRPWHLPWAERPVGTGHPHPRPGREVRT